MTTQDWKQRHSAAMNDPQTAEERTLVALYVQLAALAYRYKDDVQAIPAVVSVGSAIIRLLNYGTGRLDQAEMNRLVIWQVERAGGDPDEL